MAYPKTLDYDTIRTVAFGGITGTFADLGTALTSPARLVKLLNTTDVDAEISTDGVNVHDYVPANSFALYDLTANKVRDEGAFFRTGKQFSVRRPAAAGNPTTGGVYLVVIVGAS